VPSCEIEYADEFEQWWNSLDVAEQESVAKRVKEIEAIGVDMRRPQADTLKGSAYPNMRELRIQHQGRPYRVLYAFDPRRVGYLLIGGDKTGNSRWYDEFIPKADAIYQRHLIEIGEE